MKTLSIIFVTLTISLTAIASQIHAQKAQVQNANLSIITSDSVLTIPMLNNYEARMAADYINLKESKVLCANHGRQGTCEELVIMVGKRGYLFRADRTKLFPDYYKKIEDTCLKNKNNSNALHGKVYQLPGAHTYAHVEIKNATGNSKAYKIDISEVVFLNNTNPMDLNVWMNIDNEREKVVLLEGYSCRTLGEVPYLK